MHMRGLQNARLLMLAPILSPQSSLGELQARHAMLDSQDPMDLALGKLNYEVSQVIEALARAGDKK